MCQLFYFRNYLKDKKWRNFRKFLHLFLFCFIVRFEYHLFRYDEKYGVEDLEMRVEKEVVEE